MSTATHPLGIRETPLGLRPLATLLLNPRYVRNRTDHRAHPPEDGAFLSTLRAGIDARVSLAGGPFADGATLRVDAAPNVLEIAGDSESFELARQRVGSEWSPYLCLFGHPRNYIGSRAVAVIAMEDLERWVAALPTWDGGRRA